MRVVRRKRKTAAREARAAAYRTLILGAAERVFASKGFDGAKIKDIADEAELALGTVYAVFESKRDVFIGVHALRGGALLQEVFADIEGLEAPFEALAQAQRVACRFYAAHPYYLRMHLYSGTAWAAPRLDVDEERRAYDRGVAALVSLFASAARRGELIDERPETCALLYLAIFQVVLAEWEASGFAMAATEVTDRLERHVVRTFTPRLQGDRGHRRRRAPR
jgi:AcrR family transcriptional regulator